MSVVPGEAVLGSGVPPVPVPVPLAASEVAARVEGVASVEGPVALDAGVAALEDVRRLEAWLSWAKPRVALVTAKAAEAEQARWVAAHPAGRWFDDEDTLDIDSAAARGLSRGARLAVGERAGVAEVACALGVGEGQVYGLLDRAEQLAGVLAGTAAALAGGVITAAAGTAIVDETAEYVARLAEAGVDESTAGVWSGAITATEESLLAAAGRGRTPAQLRARARRIRERFHPESFAQRQARARGDRYVQVRPDRDGMARLSALLPAAVAWGIDGRLSALARALKNTMDPPGQAADPDAAADPGAGAGSLSSAPGARPPTIGQLRADVLADLLTGLDSFGTGPGHPGTGLSGRVGEGSRDDGPAVQGTGGRAGAEWAGAEWAGAEWAGAGGTRTGGTRPRGTEAGGLETGSGAGSGSDVPAPRVLLTVPAATLLGGDEPGELGEFGSIPAGDARDLAARAGSFLLGIGLDVVAADAERCPVPRSPAVWSPAFSPVGESPPGGPPLGWSPADGSPWGGSPPGGPVPGDGMPGVSPVVPVPVLVTTGRQYRIPAALRRALQVRDGTCRFPGCRRSAAVCDLDHVTAWVEGGESTPENLAHLCRKHHVLKHHSGWTVTTENGLTDTGSPGQPGAAAVTRPADGPGPRGARVPAGAPSPASVPSRVSVLFWTSPAGRRYTTEPDDPPPF
ncbi:HNH endonuclease [Tersicoccus phoenicis]|nr:HNH endonuclease signature motif containing protein [Tersicoccus phoenicis]